VSPQTANRRALVKASENPENGADLGQTTNL